MNRHPTPDSIRLVVFVIMACAWGVTCFTAGMGEMARHIDYRFELAVSEREQ